LNRGQLAARNVQVAAREEGAVDNYAYGSMWNARYQMIVNQFELADVPGFKLVKPKGASYRLVVVNDRVLIPFRHATSMNKPISQAKLDSLIPRRIARESGVPPERTLFDDLETDDAEDVTEVPTAGILTADANAMNLTVVYIGYVANAGSDDIQAAWWGTPISLEDDGTMIWTPERLDLSIADDHRAGTAAAGLRVVGTEINAPGFAQGDEPELTFTPKPHEDELPASEADSAISDTAAENDE
jgi:hypothetical protein